MSGVDPVSLALSRSPRLFAGLTLLHAATSAPLWWMEMPLTFKAAFTLALALHGWCTVRHLALLAAAGSVVAVDLEGVGRCALTQRSGRVLHGTVSGSTLVTGGLVILAVKVAHFAPPRRVVIASDMVDAETFRRLRVLLRWASGGVPRPGAYPV